MGNDIAKFFYGIWVSLKTIYLSVAPSDVPTAAWAVLGATAALLAFIVSVYTLVGSERKAPYIINKAFGIFLWSLLGGGFDALAAVTTWRFPLYLGSLILLFAFGMSFMQVMRISRRFIQLNDSISLKHTGALRTLKRLWRKLSSNKLYEYNAIDIPPASIDNIRAAISATFPNASMSPAHVGAKVVSMAIALDRHDQANDALALLAVEFLKGGNYVQYMTASRHPIEFIEYLSQQLRASGSDLAQFASQIIVVDAYTPHFGFVDSIYDKATHKITNDHGVKCLKSGISYAGIHSASGKAFNAVKKQSAPRAPRKPTAVIYENMYALADLESSEQYRVFLRHVMPSERLWGGMFTVFSEVSPDEGDWRILSSYASVNVDLRKSPP